jgi:hypothetical protein
VAVVQGAHHANPRKHRRPADLDHQYQGLDCGLPFGQGYIFRRQRSDVVGRVAKNDELPAVWQRDRLLEFSGSLRRR